MSSRRDFLHQGVCLSALALMGSPLSGCAAAKTHATTKLATKSSTRTASTRPAQAAPAAPAVVADTGMAPPPDIFDAQLLDLEFWLKPRVLELTRPASGEKGKLLFWKDGELIDSAYQELCHLLRDVNGKETAPIDPKLLDTLWGAQAFVARYGIVSPVEILSGYRTLNSNNKLIESGVPAARQSLHIEGKAADIRLPNLNPEVLGSLVHSFRQGGVGFYYRSSANGGWIHADTGLNRTWKG